MYRGNKKFSRSIRRRVKADGHDPIDDKIRKRIAWKRTGWGYRSLNDNGVVMWSKKRKRHRRHEIKPYKRPTKT